MSDEALFEAATKEFAAGTVNESLLAKARVLAKGDEKGTEFEYIDLRVKQLKSEKTAKYLNATKDAGRIIAPAVGSFSWHFVKTLFLAVVMLGSIVLVLSLMGIDI